jgi:hypothetical protein
MLEYLKVLLTSPVMAALVALIFFWKFGNEIKELINRIATIRLGGAELTTQQPAEFIDTKKKLSPPNEIFSMPNLTADQQHEVQQLLNAERANSYLWEYRYLNFFLVYRTQVVLNWFFSLEDKVGYTFFDSYWLPLIPSPLERQAIFTALQNHYLILVDDSGILISPKGREYVEWRGVLPPLPSK